MRRGRERAKSRRQNWGVIVIVIVIVILFMREGIRKELPMSPGSSYAIKQALRGNDQTRPDQTRPDQTRRREREERESAKCKAKNEKTLKIPTRQSKA